MLLLILGMMGSYVFGRQNSLAQTFFGKSAETQTQKFQAPFPLGLTTAGDPMDPSYFFNITNWPTSTTPKQNDYMKHVLSFVDAGSGSAILGSQFVDINGDGLLDYLFSQWPNNSTILGVIFLNNGSNNFTVGYKCAYYAPNWYGDCAQQ